MPNNVPTSRLDFTADGHADPEQLLDALVDADTRAASTGLTYLAANTPVPAAFLATDAPCEPHPWCTVTGQHLDHSGPEVSLPAGEGFPPVLAAYFYTDKDQGAPLLTFGAGSGDWQDYATGEELRAQTAKVRTHLARLDALADQHDAIREAIDDAVVQQPETSALANAAAYLSSNPDALTPELAEALSIVVRAAKKGGDPDDGARQLGDRITAEKRGPAWMAAHGCTPWCVMDHEGEDGDPGWHQGAAAVLPLPGPLSVSRRADQVEPDPDDEPLLAARVNTTNMDAEILGCTTSMWVDVPGDTMELSLVQTDRLIAGLEKLLPQLRALRAVQAEAEKGDHPGDPALKAAYRAEANARVKALNAEATK